MRYVSTRGSAPGLGFADTVLAGLATDGGLYVPASWPSLPGSLPASYADLAAVVFAPFVDGEIEPATMQRLCGEAYSTSGTPMWCPSSSWSPGTT